MDDILSHLGLTHNPFPVALDPDSYYQTESTKAFLEELIHGIESRKGFLALIGDVGVGKTSLSLQLLRLLEEKSIPTAWVFNTVFGLEELFQAILRDWGVPFRPGAGKQELVEHIQEFLLARNNEGRNCVIIIDEAHNLEPGSLEGLRMLSNLEYGGQKLVQIVLVGQQELKLALDKPQMRQLRSRIAIYLEQPPLSRQEVQGYVNFKLASAGSQLRLGRRCLNILWNATKGNLRKVNLVMERTLYACVSLDTDTITPRAVRMAVKDVAAYQSDMSTRSLSPLLLAAILVALLTLGWWLYTHSPPSWPAPGADAPPAPTGEAAPEMSPPAETIVQGPDETRPSPDASAALEEAAPPSEASEDETPKPVAIETVDNETSLPVSPSSSGETPEPAKPFSPAEEELPASNLGLNRTPAVWNDSTSIPSGDPYEEVAEAGGITEPLVEFATVENATGLPDANASSLEEADGAVGERVEVEIPPLPVIESRRVESSRAWVVQLATYSKTENAEEFLLEKSGKGFPMYAFPLGGMTLVYLGEYPARDEARRAQREFGKEFRQKTYIRRLGPREMGEHRRGRTAFLKSMYDRRRARAIAGKVGLDDARARLLLEPLGLENLAADLLKAVEKRDQDILEKALPKGYTLLGADRLPLESGGFWTFIPWEELTGEPPLYLVVWNKDVSSFDQVRPGYAGPEATDLQRKLTRAGYYFGPIDGEFGEGTKAALSTFQRKHGIRPTGLPDPASLFWLEHVAQTEY